MTAMSDSRRTEFAQKLHDEAAALLQNVGDGVRFRLSNLPDGQGTVMEYEVQREGVHRMVRECVRVTVESIAALTGERVTADV